MCSCVNKYTNYDTNVPVNKTVLEKAKMVLYKKQSGLLLSGICQPPLRHNSNINACDLKYYIKLRLVCSNNLGNYTKMVNGQF